MHAYYYILYAKEQVNHAIFKKGLKMSNALVCTAAHLQ